MWDKYSIYFIHTNIIHVFYNHFFEILTTSNVSWFDIKSDCPPGYKTFTARIRYAIYTALIPHFLFLWWEGVSNFPELSFYRKDSWANASRQLYLKIIQIYDKSLTILHILKIYVSFSSSFYDFTNNLMQ